MEPTQAPETVPATAPQAPAQAPATGSVPENLQAFVTPATAPATAPQAPAQAPANTTPEPTNPRDAGFQRLAEERQVQIYQLQQELERARTQPSPQADPERNPYDPNTQWFEAVKWETQKAARLAARESAAEQRNLLLGLAQQAAEQDWQRQHPQVDINQVKAFANQRGIRDINDAFALMMLPQTVAQAAQAGQQTTINQFTQPSVAAAPVRAQPTAGQPIGLSYEAMAREYASTHGKVYDSWPKEVQVMFDRETVMRAASERK